MGMAYVEVKKRRQPTCKGTVVCPYCDAEYSPGPYWVKGGDISQGTESQRLVNIRRIPFEVCPLCETIRTEPTTG